MSNFSVAAEDFWLTDFESEEINEGRWSCLVSAIVEAQPEDEEYLKIFNRKIAAGMVPIIHIIKMSDVVALFRPSREEKKKVKQTDSALKNEKKIKNSESLLADRNEVEKSDTTLKKGKRVERSLQEEDSFQNIPSRFPEVLAYLSKYAIISDGSCVLSPLLMAYAIKYIILRLKDRNYYQKRVSRIKSLKGMETEILMYLQGYQTRKVNAVNEDEEELWKRERFDIFNDPFKDGPMYSHQMYVVLEDFYDPHVFPELIKIKVPFRAVIRVENYRIHMDAPEVAPNTKKLKKINNFWTLINGDVSRDIALLKYGILHSNDDFSKFEAEILSGLTSILYSIFNVERLHRMYLQQMKVQRMIESLETLDLSDCTVYNKLCDDLVTEDSNAEIFVLYSIIEQVVAGVPETKSRVLEGTGSGYQEEVEKVPGEMNITSEESRESPQISTEEVIPDGNSTICFHDDRISLETILINQKLLKTEEIFERFVINSISAKIRKKFPKFTQAQRAQNDFIFYLLWKNGQETDKESFKVKVSFVVVMRLLERIKVLDVACGITGSHYEGAQNKNESVKNVDAISKMQRDADYEDLFTDIENLFYDKLKEHDEMGKLSSGVTKKIRKVGAVSDLEEIESISLENFEVECGRCPLISVDEKPAKNMMNLKKLEQFLESYEIFNLNERNLLSSEKEFEELVEKHQCYEIFEPNRTAQKLQKLFDNFNSIRYTYFSPMDTLFVLGHEDSDYRGIYYFLERGYITSPLDLRDFVRFILPENDEWVESVNAKYLKALQQINERYREVKRRKTIEIRCKLKKFLKDRIVSEKLKSFSSEVPGKFENESEDNRDYGQSRLFSLMSELEDLPPMEKQQEPEIKFLGINTGGIRIQVDDVNYEFHSADGSMVKVRTQSWHQSYSVISLIIQRIECTLRVYKWQQNKRSMFHFRESSGILVTFGSNQFPFPLRITQPNGLLIEVGSDISYIKQTYLDNYKWGEDIADEKFRCCLRNGSVLIFCIDGSVKVLCPSGTKHTCYRFSQTEENGVELYETLTPSGELWVRDDCSKCKRHNKTMTLLLGIDTDTKETYYRREDGTNCMLWPDGKLVTTYPDGTKITTKPKFEKADLFVETEEKDSTLKPTATIEEVIAFMENSTMHKNNSFEVISCSYLIEHPKYAKIYVENDKLEVRVLGKIVAEISSNRSVKIRCGSCELDVTARDAQFSTVCNHCNKMTASTIYFNSDELLSKTKNFDEQKFYVYSSGQILHKAGKKLSNGDLKSSWNNPKNRSCVFQRDCSFQRRCIIVRRDLNGMEFIDVDTLNRYHESLSSNSYKHCGKPSKNKAGVQYGYFNPVYRIGRERYLMDYENKDGHPRRLTRRNMKGNESTRTFPSLGQMKTIDVLPKVMIVRYIRSLAPVSTVLMKEMKEQIEVYLKQSAELTKRYKVLAGKVKQGPFAKYVAKELELIASTLCPNLSLYQHTCSALPYTDKDIHSITHNFELNDQLVESNPADYQTQIFPRCKRVRKPLKHSGKIPCIHENDEDTN